MPRTNTRPYTQQKSRLHSHNERSTQWVQPHLERTTGFEPATLTLASRRKRTSANDSDVVRQVIAFSTPLWTCPNGSVRAMNARLLIEQRTALADAKFFPPLDAMACALTVERVKQLVRAVSASPPTSTPIA